ncbi:hypothetical protein C8R45DRAFT_933786 [Mycena sanguinolenta]|nr:hypothetical protein C8R45DRAFT_933786 [Mycena sanguinolenta]
MPVSFRVATHWAKQYPFPHDWAGNSAKETFATACVDQNTKAGEILQFALPRGGGPSVTGLDTKLPDIVPYKNGFVAALVDAYTQDRALVIRPDDVWLAILTQFNFFVNANAELLRASFVAHEEKKELVIVTVGTRYTMDLDLISSQMIDLVHKNVVDPTLRAWAAPSFTTTTTNDTTVCAVVLMATLKKYFQYTIVTWGCGIPRVTLEGERSDWVEILARLEKLKEYGPETTAWYHLLRPVITRFVAAFDDPTTDDNIDFWQRVAHYQPGGSGRGNHYTGWISAFTVFDSEGRWMGNRLNKTAAFDPSLTAEQFWAKYTDPSVNRDLVLDGTPYHRLPHGSIPPGYGEVDVLVIDNGTPFECAMVAGSVGMQVFSSGDTMLSENGADDTVGCLAGWWLFVKDETDMQNRAKRAYGVGR